MQKLNRFIPCPGVDKILWTISSSLSFTVRSVYKILSEGGKIRSSTLDLWKTRVPPSMRWFFFLLLNNRLLTQDNLSRRNIPDSSGCVMCTNCQTETALHLFIGCPFARQVWSALMLTVGSPLFTFRDSVLQTYSESVPANKEQQGKWGIIFITTTWLLWKERNDRTFRHHSTTVPTIVARILHEAELCSKYC